MLHDASLDYSLSVSKRYASALTRQEECPAALAPCFQKLCEQALDDEYCDWSFGQDREWSDPLFPLPLKFPLPLNEGEGEDEEEEDDDDDDDDDDEYDYYEDDDDDDEDDDDDDDDDEDDY